MASFPVHFLLAPGSGSNRHGKLYVVVLAGKDSFTIHGANTPGQRGQVTHTGSEEQASKKLREKQKNGYRPVTHDKIANPVKATLTDTLRHARPSDTAGEPTIMNDEIRFGGSGGAAWRRPRTRPAKSQWDVWI